jgi:hypothetical protein
MCLQLYLISSFYVEGVTSTFYGSTPLNKNTIRQFCKPTKALRRIILWAARIGIFLGDSEITFCAATLPSRQAVTALYQTPTIIPS